MRCGVEATEQYDDEPKRQRNHQRQVRLRADAGACRQRTEQSGAEETEAPERMRPVHDAPPALVFDAIGLEVDHQFDRADAQSGRQQAHEQSHRPARMSCECVEHRYQGNQRQQRAAVAHPLDPSAGEGEREQGAAGRADQPEAELPLADAHGMLQLAQARKESAEAERVEEETGEHAPVRRQTQADNASEGSWHEEASGGTKLRGCAAYPNHLPAATEPRAESTDTVAVDSPRSNRSSVHDG